MSMHDRATAAVLAQLMMAADGAVFGIGVAYVAYRSIRRYTATSSALRKIRDAPSVMPSDLRSVLSDGDDSSSSHSDDGGVSSSNNCGKLVIVRGSVELKSAAEKGNWKNLMGSNLVTSKATDEKGVILQRTQTCIYNEWKGIFGWTADLRNMLSGSLKEQETVSSRMVPFILVEGEKWPQSDYLVVNMERSNHPLPLTTVYQHLQPIHATPYTFLQAICGLEYPVGMLYEEKILPLRKDITAVGICNLKNGILEIKSCKDLPYFLSALTKDQLVADLSFQTKVLMWSGLVFSTLAIGILGYSVASPCVTKSQPLEIFIIYEENRDRARVQTMMRNVLLSTSSNLTAAVNLFISSRRSDSAFQFSIRRLFSDSPPQSRVSELPRVDSLVDGCDYKHWLVVMQPPDNYPQRDEIIQQYVATLAMALGSEKAAKESIYSVSTKYYYAFSCKADENVTHKIKCLPRVKWVLPDSYLCDEEGGYGGEPYFDGKVVPYEAKYHADWLHDAYGGDGMEMTRSRKLPRRRSSTNATSD